MSFSGSRRTESYITCRVINERGGEIAPFSTADRPDTSRSYLGRSGRIGNRLVRDGETMKKLS